MRLPWRIRARDRRSGAARLARQDGQGLFEFAIVVPLVLLLIVALFDIGRMVYINNALAEAARDGARYGAVLGRAAAARDEVISYTESRLAAVPGAVVSVACENYVSKPGVCTTGDFIRVQVSAAVAPITPIIGQLIGALSLSSAARMTIHQ